MDTLNYPGQSNKAFSDRISCDFCAQQFGTISKKNAHILDHFEQQICQWCDQNLLRIGDSFYILHATVTCISRTEIKQEESELCGQNDNEFCVQQEHPVDEQSQFGDDCVDKQEITDHFNQIDNAGISSTIVHIDASSFHTLEVQYETNNPNQEFRPQKISDETNIKHELDEDLANLMPSAEEQVVAFDMPLPNKTVSKRSKLKKSVEKQANTHSKCRQNRQHTISRNVLEKYSCGKCGSTNLTKESFKKNHENPNFGCQECSMAFCQFSLLKDHYKHLHADADPYNGIDLARKLPVKQIRAERKVKKFQCTVDGCNELVRTNSRQNHMATKHNLFRHECDICKKVFQTSEEIRQHMITHEVQEKCSTCSTCGLTKLSYKRHYESPKFNCHECDAIFCHIDQMKDHYNQLHADANYTDGIDVASGLSIRQQRSRRCIKNIQCTVDGCNEMISANSRLNHMARKHKLFQYECFICHKIFPTRRSVRPHMSSHDTMQTKYNCSKCGSTNLAKTTYQVYHQRPNYMCRECNMAFCKFGQLKDHYKHLHRDANPCDGIFLANKLSIKQDKAQRQVKRFKCTVAGCDDIISINSRGHHMASKHQSVKFQCYVCKKFFATKVSAQAHILGQHVPSARKFHCTLCGTAYLSKSALDWHNRWSHIKEKNFMCSECGKTFCQKSVLIKHSKIHTGEEPFPFECTFEGCPKRFRILANRIRHMRTHTGEKPYQCPVADCDHRFSYTVNLKRHQFNAHDILPKKCPKCHICAEIFPDNLLLKKHMKKHQV